MHQHSQRPDDEHHAHAKCRQLCTQACGKAASGGTQAEQRDIVSPSVTQVSSDWLPSRIKAWCREPIWAARNAGLHVRFADGPA
jgi:hypothetical protein